METQDTTKPTQTLTRKLFFYLALGTLIGFSLAGYGVTYFLQDRSFDELWISSFSLLEQTVYGTAYGVVFALIINSFTSVAYFQPVKTFFASIFQGANIHFIDVLFISICAGIGEEWFFRAGLQPYLGIWATALLFVLIHGYLDFRNRPLFICGLFLVIMSAGLGYLYEYIGLASAMIAHGVYDLIVLCRLLYREPRFFRVK